MSNKKQFGSKSRRLREAQEFLEKIQYKEETDEIYTLISKKKKEIDIEKDEIANLFIMSNGRQALLKQYIDYINKKMYETDIQIDPNIEKLGEEILQMITILQIKMQMAINYTKKEMEQEIQKEFDEIERKQQEEMAKKVEEGNQIIMQMNNSKSELDQIKIRFEETNVYLKKLKAINEYMKINSDNAKSDNENLIKKLKELKNENEKIKKEFFEMENKKNSNKNLSNEEEENKDNNYILDLNQNKEEQIYTPKNIIKILKDSIKSLHNESNEVYQKINEQKKEKNEAQQLLQKCIDDLNVELNNIKKVLPKINEIEYVKNAKKDELEKKLKVLTFAYDNAFHNVRNKQLTIKKRPIFK